LEKVDKCNLLMEKVDKSNLLMEKVSAGQFSFLCTYDAIYAWVVENTWLISLIGISDFRQMEGTWISNTRRHKNHFGLMTQ